MESIGPILQIFQFIGAPFGKWWKYFKGVDENMKILKRKLEELNSRKDDIESRLSADLQSGKKLTKKEVENWLKNVQKINTETQIIEKKVGEKRYLSRARLGKLVDEKIKEVEEYYRKGSFSDGLVVDAPLSSGVTLPAPPLVGETTAKKYMNEILGYLMGDEIWKIGVCGMGGVGKTTIMKHINNQLKKETRNFDDAIWVTVSKELDVIKLQNDIAHTLNQELPKGDDKTIRAGKLFETLERKKRYVLILDDMWEAFSLEDVGIPEPTSTNGCKLVLTTRSLDVCRVMNCKVVKVGLLTKEEAWNLFSDKVGDDVLNIPTLVGTVRLVAEECACLPLAIVTVASSMRGVHDISEWRNALNELRGRVKKGMENEVFERLKFSYDRLKDWKLQQCFLYCALYPEDYEIRKKKLIDYWIAEGLVDEMSSRTAEYDKGYAILHRLENSCLLERSSTNDRIVKMHDLVRDMALNIIKESPLFMAKAGMRLNEFPNEREWTADLEKVSLMKNSISEIPSDMSPTCQRLQTLLLQRNPLKGVSDSFFVHMLRLKVLDLSYTSIEILPNNITNLEHLSALSLRGCSGLKHVPWLATLKALRMLDLTGTGIKEAPQDMKMLVNLRCLYLGGYYLKMFPTGILPKLSHLQDLIIDVDKETLRVKAEEVASLKKLETFVGQFYDLHDFNVYARRLLQGQGLHSYHLQVGVTRFGNYFDEEEGFSSSNKCVVLRECRISSREEDPLVLPNDMDHLMIYKCHDVSNLSDVSSLKIHFLKECVIRDCYWIECVLFSSSYNIPLQSLEVLLLHSLPNLRVLFRGEEASPPPLGTFSNLKILEIFSCPNLEKLFMPGLLPHLQNLEKLSVWDGKMEEIIEAKSQGEEEDDEEKQGMCGTSNHSNVHNNEPVFTITLPQLAYLHLSSLPELKSIVRGRGVMVCDSLQVIDVYNCPKLKRLSLSLPMLNGQPSPPSSLQRVAIGSNCWESLEWDHPTAKDVLQSFISRL